MAIIKTAPHECKNFERANGLDRCIDCGKLWDAETGKPIVESKTKKSPQGEAARAASKPPSSPIMTYKLGDKITFTIPNVKRKWWQFWLPKVRTVTKIYEVTHVG